MGAQDFKPSWGRGLQRASELLITRGTVMGPMVPVLFVVPFFIAGSIWLATNGPTWLSAGFGIAAIAIPSAYTILYSYFGRTDPDRLQSEEFRHQMHQLHMIAGKDLPFPIPADSLQLAANTNPALPDIEVPVEPKIEREGRRE